MHDKSSGTSFWRICIMHYAPAARMHPIKFQVAVQLRKRAARACLERELFAAILVPWYHLTCRLPSWTPVMLQEGSQLIPTACRSHRSDMFEAANDKSCRTATRAVILRISIWKRRSTYIRHGHDPGSIDSTRRGFFGPNRWCQLSIHCSEYAVTSKHIKQLAAMSRDDHCVGS